MVTSRVLALAAPWLLIGCAAHARETPTPASCQAAAAQAPIAEAKAAAERAPQDLGASVALADTWSDAGCFNEAVQVLQAARTQHPGNQELETRLRVARSLVGEQTYFENLDRADADARIRRDRFRCTTLSDLEACSDAVRLKPDDPTLLVELGDALVQAQRPGDAVGRYRRAAVLAPGQTAIAGKLAAAEEQSRGAAPPAQTAEAVATADRSPAPGAKPDLGTRVAAKPASLTHGRLYSNLEPVSRSH